MPLYEFECRGCGQQFEALVRAGTTPVCTKCQSGDLHRLTSMFAVNSENTRALASQSARLRNSKTQRDQRAAEQEELHHHHD
jgi:putative FmdB family regulatory protein